MDSLFFIASKTIGMVARVESWFLALLLLALVLGAMGRTRVMRRVMGLTFVLVLALTIFPLGTPLMRGLEGQYPANPALPDHVDGIVVLGGAEDMGPSTRWGVFATNEGGERLIAGAELAHRFPAAKLVFTGGAASLVHDDSTLGPSQMAKAVWTSLGVDAARIVVEDQSRNTAENASLTKAIVAPKEGEVWVLVTSAFHMPRSVETFQRNGWPDVIAWPVDFRSGGNSLRAEWRLDDHMSDLNVALKEYLGLTVYRWRGK